MRRNAFWMLILSTVVAAMPTACKPAGKTTVTVNFPKPATAFWRIVDSFQAKS